ncbi:transposase [Pseudomonas fluorescens]|uniref:transposase n=1 Tax=Pseudomonas fluorescens TaxID=294 RepID=UPI001CD7351A|nr:transposase [Pseudomonas fluorescens]
MPPLIQFAKRLKGYWRDIVSRVRRPTHTGQLEGINNRVKVTTRRAYGYRDKRILFHEDQERLYRYPWGTKNEGRCRGSGLHIDANH